MNKLDIERSLRCCIEQDTPDLLDSLMSTPVRKLSGEDYIVKQRPVERNQGVGRYVAAFGSVAMLCIVCLSFMAHGGWNSFVQKDNMNTFIAIDVNPSIEMMADDNNMVSGIHGLNEDAEIVLQDVDTEEQSLDQVVSSLVESMAEHGYLKQDEDNSILVSVENPDVEKAQEIKSKITADIYEALDKSELDSVVMTQDVKKTKELEKEAEKLNISVGKMSFISNLAEKDEQLDVQEMAGMSIGAISDLAQEHSVDLSDTVEFGKAKEKVEPSVGVPVEKTETTSEVAVVVDATSDNSSSSTDTTTGHSTVATTQAPVSYELNDYPTPVVPESPAQEEPQVVAQDPNVVAKPVEEPTTAPSEQSTESYEVREEQEPESGEIIE